MARFFEAFPKIAYDIKGSKLKTFNQATNIFFRLRVIREVLSNVSAYYEYVIREGDTPEVLAEKIYGEAEAHWIILMANDIIDAQYDWPLNGRDFKNYIIDKYGSIESAKTTLHHYEKVVTRIEEFSGTETQLRYQIDYEPKETYEIKTTILVEGTDEFDEGQIVYSGPTTAYSDAVFSAVVEEKSHPYYTLRNITTANTANLTFGTILRGKDSTDSLKVAGSTSPDGTLYVNGSIFFNIGKTYDTYISLPEVQYVQTFNWGTSNNTTTTTTLEGRTITQITNRATISNYDYEVEKNENKRPIKIIKPEYYPQIISELNVLTNRTRTPYLRRLIV